MAVTYTISVQTSGAHFQAGTNSIVSIELVGETSSTGYMVLDQFWVNDFEKGDTNVFHVWTRNVGLPIMIRLRLSHFLFWTDDWLCNRIVVALGHNQVVFPVYDWIFDNTEATTGPAMLPQKVTHAEIRNMRVNEIAKSKQLFKWTPTPTPDKISWGLPLHVNASNYFELPRIFRRKDDKLAHFAGSLFQTGFTAIFDIIKTCLFVPITSLESFHELCRHSGFGDEEYDENWKTDEAMGRQVLTGINPLAISRCTSLPSYFNVTNDDVSQILGSGKTLQSEMMAGKLYIGDYSTKLTGVVRNPELLGEKFHCANAIGLFYVNAEGNFVPIAIQLVPGDRQYLFTPADSEADWLLAKMYYQCACSSWHEWVTHFLLTHNIVEPFAVAMFQCFPRSHPLYKMLRPHLRTVSAINTDARLTLLPAFGIINQCISLSAASLARKSYKDFTYEDMVFPKILAKLGLDDKQLLPNDHFRDDGITLWNIMDTYVSGVLRHYYKSDKDVQDDHELQDFAQNVAKNGFGWQDGNTHGMPESITTIDQLVEFCVAVIFTSSAQHAAVNFGQFETYKFIPSNPPLMRLPPHKKGEATDKRILDTLPNNLQSATFIAVTHTLSQFSPGERYLGQYAESHFTEKAIHDIQAQYRVQLAGASNQMKARNAGLKKKYTYLLPERVPNSIAI